MRFSKCHESLLWTQLRAVRLSLPVAYTEKRIGDDQARSLLDRLANLHILLLETGHAHVSTFALSTIPILVSATKSFGLRRGHPVHLHPQGHRALVAVRSLALLWLPSQPYAAVVGNRKTCKSTRGHKSACRPSGPGKVSSVITTHLHRTPPLPSPSPSPSPPPIFPAPLGA